MAQQKFAVSVSEETGERVKQLVDECADLGANRSEIVDAVLTAYFRSTEGSTEDEIARTRELIKRHWTESDQ